ncbi:MAG: hypothetical protein F4X56_07905 [Gammaproteobacteria bacterium]|nr:hypothetical protein [Gammaproteobacteria bacterium]
MSQHGKDPNFNAQITLRKQLVMVGIVLGIAIGSLGSLAFVIWSDGDRSKSTLSDSIAANQEPNATRETTVQNELSPELSKLSKVDSMIEIVSEFDRLSTEQMAALAQQTTNLEPRSKRSTIQTLLIGELSRRDPKHALEQVWKMPRSQWTELVPVVFSEWSLINIEDSFATSMELHAALRETAIRSLLNTRTELSNNRWLTLAAEHDFEESILTLLREREAIALLDSPLDAFQLVIQDDVDDQLQRDLIQKIARTMVQQNGYESFDPLIEYSIWWFSDLLLEEAESNPIEFFSVIKSLPTESRNSVIYPLVKAWVPLDPSTAYESISSLEEFKDKFYYHNIFRIWAEVDLEGLFTRVESFPRSERAWAAYSALLELVKKSPEEALNRTFDYESIVGVDVLDLQESLISEWAASDPKAAVNWVTANTTEDTWDQAWLLWMGLREFVKIDPEAALEFALSQAPESVYVERGFADRVIDDVVDGGELELAMAALDRLPENARIDSFTSVGTALALEHRWQEVVELIEGFSDEEQVRYFNTVTYFAMRDDLFKLLETVPKLPSEKARRLVAQGMLRNHERYGGSLTTDQVNYLQQFVDQNDDSNENHLN